MTKRRLLLASALLLLAAGALAAPWAWRTMSLYPMQQDLPDGELYQEYFHKRFGPNKHQAHGPYTQYFWRGGPVSIRGAYAHGERDGVWTYFDERGATVRQDRFDAGRVVESRSAPPWWAE